MKVNIRHLLFPFVLWFYYAEAKARRGQFLHAYRFQNYGDDAVELTYGRFEGFKYGTVRFQTTAPHVTIRRNDGVRIEHDFRSASASELRINASETSLLLVLVAPGQQIYEICRISVLQAIQLIGVFHRLPDDLKHHFKGPEEDPTQQRTGAVRDKLG